jgi:RNA polymerase sigma-70 factor (ECF subfamily)
LPPEEIQPLPLPVPPARVAASALPSGGGCANPAPPRTASETPRPSPGLREGHVERAPRLAAELASADGRAANGDATPFDPEDRVLVERILAGDEDAFRALVEKFHRRVAAVVRRYAGGRTSALEDHAQEVFLRVYRGLPSFQGGSSLGTWIHRIAVNYLITDVRKRRALKRDQRTLSIDAPIGGEDGDLRIEVAARGCEPSAAVFDGERGVAIRRAMEALEDDLRQIVVLREIEQRSYEEIAEIVDIPIGTVRSRLHRARGILQERLRSLL